MAEHVAPILTVPQARALAELLPAEIERMESLRGAFEPSTYTRTLHRQIASLRRALDEIRRVLPPDRAAPGTPTSEGTP